MSSPRPPLWTTSRRLAGNLAPLVVIGPGLGLSLWLAALDGISPRSLAAAAGTLAAGWLSVNFMGLIGNSKMKREMGRRLHEERPFDRCPKWFVGFARPSYRGLLDPHEDLGFLILEEERLLFWGAERQVELHRDQIVRIRHRPNIHTLLGLGRWVAVEAVLDGAPARLLVEPRDRPILLANMLASRRLKDALTDWARQSGPLRPEAKPGTKAGAV